MSMLRLCTLDPSKYGWTAIGGISSNLLVPHEVSAGEWKICFSNALQRTAVAVSRIWLYLYLLVVWFWPSSRYDIIAALLFLLVPSMRVSIIDGTSPRGTGQVFETTNCCCRIGVVRSGSSQCRWQCRHVFQILHNIRSVVDQCCQFNCCDFCIDGWSK